MANEIPTQVRPMLAAKFDPEITKKHIATDGYLYCQPKIDGMRILFDEGIARSRAWKPWTNKYLQMFAADFKDVLQGWDCEGLPGLHWGDSVDPNVFRTAMSELRSMDGTKKFTLYLFDNFDLTYRTESYRERFKSCKVDLGTLSNGEEHLHIRSYDGQGTKYEVLVRLCPNYLVSNLEQISALEAEFLANGFEGAMLKRCNARYKYNRATTLGGELTKIKQMEDDEAVIIGYEVAYENQNEAEANELGLTSRSSHLANLVEKDYLGSLSVSLLKAPNICFKIGVMRGVSIEQRKKFWTHRDELLHKVVTFKHQGYGGGYDKPRTPVFLSFRDPCDLM